MISHQLIKLVSESHRSIPVINHHCRYEYKGHSHGEPLCQRCVDICPSNAISPNTKTIDDDKCTQCGLCVFICQFNAIDNISLPARHFYNNHIYINQANDIHINELISWFKQTPKLTGILAPKITPDLLALLNKMNIYLIRRQRPIWTVALANNIHLPKRALLSVANTNSNNSNDKNNTSCEMTKASLKTENVSVFQLYKIELNQEDCTMCLACTRSCPTRALQQTIELDDQVNKQKHLKIDSVNCNGCRACQVTCPHLAITITPIEHVAPTINIALKQTNCMQCKQYFWQASDKNQTRCFICNTPPPHFRMTE